MIISVFLQCFGPKSNRPSLTCGHFRCNTFLTELKRNETLCLCPHLIHTSENHQKWWKWSFFFLVNMSMDFIHLTLHSYIRTAQLEHMALYKILRNTKNKTKSPLGIFIPWKVGYQMRNSKSLVWHHKTAWKRSFLTLYKAYKIVLIAQKLIY